MKIKRDLKYDELCEIFTIDDAGNLYWKIKPSGCVNIGDSAGTLNSNKYKQVKIRGKIYVCHRIAYIMHNNSEIPDGLYIDHIDRNRTNNRKDNLRISTNRGNQHNKINQAEYANMFKQVNGNYTIRFQIKNKSICFGTYPLQEALEYRDYIMDNFENICGESM